MLTPAWRRVIGPVATAVLIAMSLSTGACEDPRPKLSPEELEKIRAELGLAEERVDFEIIAPEYLPDGTDRDLFAFEQPEDGINFVFVAIEDDTIPLHMRARVEIVEASSPFAFHVGLPEVSIAGIDVGISKTEGRAEQVRVDLFWNREGMGFVVLLSWLKPSAPLIEVTEEMEHQAILVAESIIAQGIP